MSLFDDISVSIRELYRKLAYSGRRTATITRLRIEMSGLDKQRMEIYSKLGEHVDELRRVGQINDTGLVGLLEGEFMSLDRVKIKITETMDTIRNLNIDEASREESSELIIDDEPVAGSQNLIDSFEVL